MSSFDHLKTMTREQLLELAGKQGLTIHPRSKNETIIKHIVEAAVKPATPAQKAPESPLAPSKEPVYNTVQQIEEVLAPIKARVPDFEAIYNEEEKTVKFSCRGAVETHNMSVPLRWLREKAQIVSRGRLVPMGLNQHFESLNSASGKNSYTNTVLAG